MRKNQFSYHLLNAGLAFFISYFFIQYMFPIPAPVEIVCGWGLALANHLAGAYIKEMGMKKEAQAAVRHLSGLNFLRFILLLLVVLGGVTLFPDSHETFIYALLSSYIVFMTGDLIRFYRFYKQRP